MSAPAIIIAPVLECPPLRLVPFAKHHLSSAYVGWLNDRTIMRYSEQRHRDHTADSCNAYVTSIATAGNILWAIEVPDECARHIGNISVNYDRNNGLADISILIGADGCQGKGYGKIAWGAVLGWLKTDVNLRKITGGCLAPNTAMKRIMQSTGMLSDGTRPKHYILDGDMVDIVYFAMRK